ncbi:nineteen complex-related protein 2-domain-containing protein [Talaromyces proteolyticus]|uniref:Nineteen complex-related protein 2-domain-containing protein n=1 Tax=Talaromyces proteolyticus TaxID=1131652 RepID=A0AAD4KZN1_9EURO|nr:nineteen complex-related protein 2-domain-containing protein [Talaromyces proteolyticus]KAH8701051.1 nineteen complex-related protein 2-domain-containing protein [Talaromyces proteolyticus]
MNSPFANRRKPRKIGGEDEEDNSTSQDSEPVVKRPSSLKPKHKSKLRLSFGPGETSMVDDGDDASGVVTPKRPGLGRRVLEKNALQKTPSTTGSATHLPFRVGQEQDRPAYGEDYLKELRDSTPSTPKATDSENDRKEIDVTAKFGEVMQMSGATAIPSEAEIREKKARRARLANEPEYISLEVEDEAEEDYMALDHKKEKEQTRLVRDDEDFAEGFDEFVEDGKISLGRKAEREQQRRQREQMRELINEAEGSSEEEDSDAERNAAYEAAQTRAGMDGMERERRGNSSRPKTPPKIASLPNLPGVLGRLRANLAEAEGSKKLLLDRMEELRKEKADIAVREVEIQALIKDAGEQYEKLRLEAGLTPGGDGLPGDATPNDRGLESLGGSLTVSRVDSETEPSRTNRPKYSVHLIPWLASPLDENSGAVPRLRQRSDASPIELFYDVFLVANLATFSATHEITDIKAVWSYVGFVGIIWFTWLQVTLFDLRFSRDSIFERTCKVVQLCTMVGFASAGSRFSTRIQDENVWAFRSLCALLSGSRFMLAVQYMINLWFIHDKMYAAAKGMLAIIGVLSVTGVTYLVLYFTFGPSEPHVWTAWFGLFLFESLAVIAVSTYIPGLELDNTHLTTRMGLLTLIIVGEHVISVTRIVKKMIGGGGWTLASLLHVMGVVTTVYLLWHSYYDISPRNRYGRLRQQIWTHLHFPFHMSIILSSEGCQILALALDISLKLRYLLETMQFACEDPPPLKSFALELLNRTIVDMEIDFSKSPHEKAGISHVMATLWNTTDICAEGNSTQASVYGIPEDQGRYLSGNVTVALFSSMDILPEEPDSTNTDGMRYVRVYLGLLTFVYIYYFITVGLAMAYFGIFTILTRRHSNQVYNAVAVAFRFLCAIVLMSQVAFAKDFNLTYRYMTHPIILYTFSLTMLSVLLVDRVLDTLAKSRKVDITRKSSTRSRAPIVSFDQEADSTFYEG